MNDMTPCERCGYDFPCNLAHLTDIDSTGIICPDCLKELKQLRAQVRAEVRIVMGIYIDVTRASMKGAA